MQTNINDITRAGDIISDLLLHLNISLSAYNDFARNMKRALDKIGKISRHDRIHIIEVHRNMTFTVRHEWCDQEIEPVPEKWKHSRIVATPPLEEQLCSQNYIVISDNNITPDSDLYTLLQEQNCRQMLILPLFESGAQFAFMLFMQCKQVHNWEPDEIHLLTDISSVIATQLNNYHLMHHLLHHIKELQTEKESIDMWHKRLQQVHAELVPAWNKIKNAHPEMQQTVQEVAELDKHLDNLDKICHTLAEK